MNEALQQLDEQPPEVIAPEQEQANVPTEPSEAVSEPPQEDIQERNWRQARLKMDEQQRNIQKLEWELEQIRRQAQKPAEEEEEQYFTESEKKLAKKIEALESKLEGSRAKDQEYVVDRLRMKFPDFDDVVNPENIAYLQQNNAPLARALSSLKDDPYEQGLAAYEALRHTEWFKTRHTMQDKAKLEANVKKPMSVQAVRKQGPLSESNQFINGLTPELKKQLQQEMAQARKGA